jgi:hypothetical protein
MILSFGSPSSQPIVWDNQPCVWVRELHLERGTPHYHIDIHSLGKYSRDRQEAERRGHVQTEVTNEESWRYPHFRWMAIYNQSDRHQCDSWCRRNQTTWIETFVEGVTDKITGLPIFKEVVWFGYKVSGVMCSVSACDHCWSIEGWIHSKRRNKVHQKLVEKLVHTHTNLVMRESLDDVLRHLLPWDIEYIIDEPVDETEEEPEV